VTGHYQRGRALGVSGAAVETQPRRTRRVFTAADKSTVLAAIGYAFHRPICLKRTNPVIHPAEVIADLAASHGAIHWQGSRTAIRCNDLKRTRANVAR